MKNHTKIRKITEVHQVWMAWDANQLLYIEGIGKVWSSRMIRSWPLKKIQKWLQEDEIWIVRRKNNLERIRLTTTKAAHAMAGITDPNHFALRSQVLFKGAGAQFDSFVPITVTDP